MPTGLYKRSKKTLDELRKKGFQKGHIGWNKGQKGLQKHSIETRQKLREINLGKKHSEETKRKMRGKRKGGWKHSEESKLKMSKVRKGIKLSIKTCEKMSEARKGDKNPNWKGGIPIIENARKWRKNNWDKVLFYNLRRASKKKNAKGSHTFEQWENLKKKYNYMCPCCRKKEPEIKLSEDHIIPLSKGGSDYINNIQPLCRSCNCKKHTKIKKY